MRYITPVVLTLFAATVVYFPSNVDGLFIITTVALLVLGELLRKKHEQR